MVERRSRDGSASLALSWPGGLGALAACTAKGLYGAQSEQPGLDRERLHPKKWKGGLFGLSFRSAIENAGTPRAALDALPSLMGNRVVIGSPTTLLLEAMIPSEGEGSREVTMTSSFMPSRSDFKEPPAGLHESMARADELDDPAAVLFGVRPKDADGPVVEVAPDRLILRPAVDKSIPYVLK